MTDIWDEKPVRPSSETTLMFERRRYSWEYQLKMEYDKLKEKAEKWDELKNIVPKLEERLRLLEKLEAVKTHIESESLSTYGLNLPPYITRASINSKDLHAFLTDLMKILENRE